MADDTPDPSKPSADYEAMCHRWAMVEAILQGAEAMREVNNGDRPSISGPAQPAATLAQLSRGGPYFLQAPYLPAFPNETQVDYELRRRFAPFYNVYSEISASLTAKPFGKPVKLTDKAPSDMEALSENIDGQGNNLHVVASQIFKAGVDKGVHYILVEYPNVPLGGTLADERKIGARPYWVSLSAERVKAVYRHFLNGQSIIYHARYEEYDTKIVGFDEVCVERVRVLSREPLVDGAGQIVGFGPAVWDLWELIEGKDAQGKVVKNWQIISSGVFSVGEIPLVAFQPAEQGQMACKPRMPLLNIAHDQVELFQQDSNLKSSSEMAGSPMIAVLGAPPAKDNEPRTVPVGPKASFLLEFGGSGEVPDVKYVEPQATSLKFLQDRYESHVKRMKDAGLMPLSDANLTVVTSANLMMRANSQVQAWTFRLKDALEQAWTLTTKWVGRNDTVEVEINTDFAADIDSGAKATSVLAAQKQNVISRKEAALNLQNLSVLRKGYDYDADEQQMAEEQQGEQLQPEKMIDPVTGAPVVVTPEHGVINPPPQPKPAFN